MWCVSHAPACHAQSAAQYAKDQVIGAAALRIGSLLDNPPLRTRDGIGAYTMDVTVSILSHLSGTGKDKIGDLHASCTLMDHGPVASAHQLPAQRPVLDTSDGASASADSLVSRLHF